MSEPFGFLILTICLGYVVSGRAATNEAEWISMAGEMRAARKIQAAILPVSMPRLGDWSFAARYAPMTAVLAWSADETGPGQSDDITFVVVELG